MVVLLVSVAVSVRLFVFPNHDSPQRVDAVVALAGEADRLPAAVALVQQGWADVLVVSVQRNPPTSELARLQSRVPKAHILTFQPDPNTSTGEAGGIAQIVSEHGWSSIIVVTSTYHITRAYALISRCTHARVLMVPSTPLISPVNWIGRIFHEAGGMVKLAFSSGC